MVLDQDLTLYLFKSAKEEESSPLSSLPLKDGATIYQKREKEKEEKREKEGGGGEGGEGVEKKRGEKVVELYGTLTPEETTEAVVGGGWRLVMSSEKVLEEWIEVLEAHTLCVLTFNPPVVIIFFIIFLKEM